jgi:hypothetical protein
MASAQASNYSYPSKHSYDPRRVYKKPPPRYIPLSKKIIWSASLSGGYGNFSPMAAGTGDTGFARFALGSALPASSKLVVGSEIGIQSAKRMQLTNDSVSNFFVNLEYALPVYFTITPPIDLLITVNYDVVPWLFVEAKGGGVYLQSMVDGANISSNSKWLPELQAGMGFNMDQNTRLGFHYQQFFGQLLTVSQVNLLAGTGVMSGMPTWYAGLLTVDFKF